MNLLKCFNSLFSLAGLRHIVRALFVTPTLDDCYWFIKLMGMSTPGYTELHLAGVNVAQKAAFSCLLPDTDQTL